MTATQLRNRTARLFISEADIQVDGLRIAFDLTRTLSIEPNKATFRVWNFNRQSRQKVEGLGTLFTRLFAGYGRTQSEIFTGDVSRVWTQREGPDLVTHFEVGDGEEAYKLDRINLGIASEQDFERVAEKMIRQLVRQTKLNGSAALSKLKKGDYKGAGKKLARGFAASGRTLPELQKLIKSGGLEVSVQNNEIQILAAGDFLDGGIVELSADRGLLGNPTVMPNGLVKARSLLIPDLDPGRLCKIKSAAISGDLRMERGRYTGDTRGAAWFVEGEYSLQGST